MRNYGRLSKKRKWRNRSIYQNKENAQTHLNHNEKLLLHLVHDIGIVRALQVISGNLKLDEQKDSSYLAEKEKEQDKKIEEILGRINAIEALMKAKKPMNSQPKELLQHDQSVEHDLKVFHYWEQVLYELKSKLTKPSYDTWIKGTIAKLYDDDTIIVFSKNEFQSDWLKERYKDILFHTVKEVAGQTFDIEFAVEEARGRTLCFEAQGTSPMVENVRKGETN